MSTRSIVFGVLIVVVLGSFSTAAERAAVQQPRPAAQAALSLSQLEQLLANRTPDAAIARELESRGADIEVDDSMLNRLSGLGAGPRTLERLRVLQPKGVLIVKAGQPDAHVFIGGQPVGSTGDDGTLLVELAAGTRSVNVRKDEYVDSPVLTVAVKPSQETVAEVTLELQAVRAGFGGVAPPMKIKDVRPVYTPAMRAARVQGVVIVEITTSVDGTVRDARVLRSIPTLDEAALHTVKQWVYAPVVIRGVARPVTLTATVDFRLP